MMEVLYPKYISVRKMPINLKQEDLHLFANALKMEVPEVFISNNYNLDILNDTIFNCKELRFKGTYTHTHELGVRRKIKSLLRYCRKCEKVAKGVWIADNYSFGYFHWLTECLTRLVTAEKYLSNNKVLLPIKFKALPYVTESLHLLGYEPYFYNPQIRTRVHELILPSHAARGFYFNQIVINRLRERFNRNNYVQPPYRKIFISRAKAWTRKIINEQVLIPILNKYGIEIHLLEDYTFTEQVKLMQETTILIGVHGAGLTNMLFMPVGGKVLELRNKYDNYWNMFFALASDLKHQYYYMLNEAESADTHNGNIDVNAKAFEGLVNLLLA